MVGAPCVNALDQAELPRGELKRAPDERLGIDDLERLGPGA